MNDTTVNDGGPAFPGDNAHDGHNGMTLRDYFATKAMQGEIVGNHSGISSICKVLGILASEYDWTIHWPIFVSKMAYITADAMIAARAQTGARV